MQYLSQYIPLMTFFLATQVFVSYLSVFLASGRQTTLPDCNIGSDGVQKSALQILFIRATNCLDFSSCTLLANHYSSPHFSQLSLSHFFSHVKCVAKRSLCGPIGHPSLLPLLHRTIPNLSLLLQLFRYQHTYKALKSDRIAAQPPHSLFRHPRKESVHSIS